MGVISPYEGLAHQIRWQCISMERRGIIPGTLVLANSDREGLATELGIPLDADWNTFDGLPVVAGPWTMLGVPVKVVA